MKRVTNIPISDSNPETVNFIVESINATKETLIITPAPISKPYDNVDPIIIRRPKNMSFNPYSHYFSRNLRLESITKTIRDTHGQIEIVMLIDDERIYKERIYVIEMVQI